MSFPKTLITPTSADTCYDSVSNLGGTFPRFFILKFVDGFSKATCLPPSIPPTDLKGDLITQPFSCVLEAEKHRCVAGGGTCNMETDGKLFSFAPFSRIETNEISRILHRQHSLCVDRRDHLLGLHQARGSPTSKPAHEGMAPVRMIHGPEAFSIFVDIHRF